MFHYLKIQIHASHPIVLEVADTEGIDKVQR